MDRDFFLNPGLQFKQSIQHNLMTMIPEMNFSTTQGNSQLNWGKSDQNPQFESTLFSNQMLTSPVSNSTISNNIRTNTSLNSSPQKMNLQIMDQFEKEKLLRIRNSILLDPNLPLIAADPGFAERAAKFSCFGSQNFNGRTISNQLGVISNKTEFTPLKIDQKLSSPALKIDRSPVGFEENKNLEETHMKRSKICSSGANSNEESSVSEQIPSKDIGLKNSNSRKRKGVSKTKNEEGTNDDSNSKKLKENIKVIEAPKDYIHVRARRGQATDSHSLAERVRREKISERMKLLQDLVPNCDKVTGKAVMLDEIINYIQSLQGQVEFLSMKLATVNPSLDFDTNSLLSQNVNQSNGSLSEQTSILYQQNPQVLFNGSTPMTQPTHEFHEPFPQFPGFGQDDLQSIVRMGFGENLDLDTSFFHKTMINHLI